MPSLNSFLQIKHKWFFQSVWNTHHQLADASGETLKIPFTSGDVQVDLVIQYLLTAGGREDKYWQEMFGLYTG